MAQLRNRKTDALMIEAKQDNLDRRLADKYVRSKCNGGGGA